MTFFALHSFVGNTFHNKVNQCFFYSNIWWYRMCDLNLISWTMCTGQVKKQTKKEIDFYAAYWTVSELHRRRFAAAVYSRLTGCGDADPGRHCGGSPCLSHCSQSAHEFPLDCPKLVILLLYTHAYIYTVIHTHTQTELQAQLLKVHQALPENVWCKH